jgi:hypothetical protein
MAAGNGAGKSGRQAASAARAEKSPKQKKYEFNGVKFVLPPLLPDTIMFDIVDMESGNAVVVFRTLKSILGSEQFYALRQAVDDQTIKAEELDTFIEGLFEKYGVSPGEPSASPTS